MKIKLHEITIKDIAAGYTDRGEDGVLGYNGKLNIRPPYQREFVYDDKKRQAVMNTIVKGFPLNVMYWVKNADGTFEILDGQQRTISFCQYISGDFSLDNRYFDNLTQTEKNRILNYKCMIYFCEGNDLEKLERFKTINIAGEKLTDQELRNAVYTGPWLADAKKMFSKNKCAAYNTAFQYVSGSPIRQELLETAIDWISKDDIEGYMAKHQHDPNAFELRNYFRTVVDRAKSVFPIIRKELKSINWAELYEEFHGNIYDAKVLEKRIAELFADDEVTNKKGIYYYVLNGKEKYLNLRAFTESQKRTAYSRQSGICPRCATEHKPTAGKSRAYEEMEADHITPRHLGGKTEIDNCQMLCRECNREKGGK